ncbi:MULTISPECIES: TonB-dependent receptor [Syntrophotalea]|uniref:TonB-dependent receptor plug domain-containing protein n=1 Tax=Syntrophotalea acetylenica TaxID=29542 RepID=A0A1L3GJF5_SYNAC|nr:TonB-dependent receptor [Syntrophotalea acetylenica]APG26073.1 hypothetical protein A7E75_14450 [Syntrophotalea acetylenica]APG44139.1 hypothetical protein A6070_08485 [Syntrophotalea acetylenica]
MAFETTPCGQQDDEPLGNVSTVLPPIMVKAAYEPLSTASRTIERKIIEGIPAGNGSISDMLTFLPDIQYGEAANLSSHGGEILPAAVSISGGKAFENNFIIDGLGNNSLLDPDADNPLEHNNVPGHAQEIFLDASLVEDITVYDHNVPASFGDFKGGVVHARTIDPAADFGGSLFYRTTRDAWTSFHIAASEREKFENSADHSRQPEFKKHQAGFDVHAPFSPRLRMLAAYRLFLSSIPLQYFGETRKQQRRNETFLLKLSGTPAASSASTFDLSWLYSPYKGRYFQKDFRNSDMTILGGAYQINAELRTGLPFADLHLQAGYKESENSRQAPDHMRQTQNPDNSWDREGFPGDIEKTQQTLQCKADLELDPLRSGAFSHKINLGADFQNIEGTSRRDETSYLYTFFSNGTNRRNVYEQYAAEARLQQYSLYLEDILRYKRLELRPGLRLSYDDFMENLNLAPRFAVTLDLLGNRQTILTGGINRYYANTLLAYRLLESMPGSYIEQGSDTTGWTLWKTGSTDYDFASLRTPCADEYVIGLEQRLLGGRATLTYVKRNGRDEFARTMSDRQADGKFHYSLNNNGRSRHESYRLSWERQWPEHFISINATYQKTTSANESYNDLLDDEDLDEEIWYHGRAIAKSALPRKDFNRPWVISLLHIGKLPCNFSVSSLLKYRSGYQTLQASGELHEDLGIPVYEKTRLGGGITADCKIDWTTRLWAGHKVMLSLEILNLLNKKNPVGEPRDGYEMGRQFWLGAQYFF